MNTLKVILYVNKKIFGRENLLRLSTPLNRNPQGDLMSTFANKQLAAEAVLFDYALRASSEL